MVTQRRRKLLICGVTGLSEENEVVSYRWFHSHAGKNEDRYEIQDIYPYYRVVKDTQNQGGKYTPAL